MATPFETITFNEGEPIDPNKLNKLQENIVTTYATANTLFNSTIDGQTVSYKTITDCGVIECTGVSKGTTKSFDLDLGTGFENVGTNPPRVVATLSGGLGTGDVVTISITGAATSSPKLFISNSNSSRSTFNVMWVAVQKVAV
jgi:hypothetical protein